MKTFQDLLVECWYDHLDLESIKKWAYSYISENDDIPEELFELLDADKYQFEGLLLTMSVAADKSFSHQSLKAEMLAAKHLIGWEAYTITVIGVTNHGQVIVRPT